MPRNLKPKKLKTRKLTEYNLFMQKHMRLIREANPGIKQTEVMKMAAQLYRIEKGKSL
jgi:hypothetical protein